MMLTRWLRGREHGLERLAAASSAAALIALASAVPDAAAQEGAAGEDTAVIDALMWAQRSNGEDLPWEEADAYCETLELDGHDDWRLPTLEEAMAVHDPSNEDNGHVMSPLQLDGCCMWSSTSLEELSAEEVGVRSDQRDDPAGYHWGFLFPAGIRYYSVDFMPDGQAHCVRDPE